MLAHSTCRLLLAQICVKKPAEFSTLRSLHTQQMQRHKLSSTNVKKHNAVHHISARGIRQKPAVGLDPAIGYSSIQTVWRKLFGKYLLATNTISSGLLMVIGDLAAQEIEYQRSLSKSGPPKKRCDSARVWRMFIVGCLQGPMHHYVYKWMDMVMPAVNMRNTMRKILMDQLVMSPLCILLFFYPACYLEDRSLREANAELVHKFGYIYLTDWLVWPPAQFINFHYLDSKYRVIFVNVCTAMYNVFLSFMKHDFD